MAQSKPERQFTDDDLIECGICHIDIDQPRSLLCLHTYCLRCLQEWSKNSKDEVICRLCRESTPLPDNGVSGLRNNFLITKLKERKGVLHKLMDKDVKIVCTSCDVAGDAEAVARCLDCDDFLCDACFKAHKNMRLMKHHTVMTLVELRSGEFGLKQQKFKEEFCTEHKGQVFWFFCNTCDVPICRDCSVVEHPTGTHDVVKLASVVSAHKDEISQLASRCQAVKRDIDDAVEKSQSLREDLRQSTDAAIKTITDVKKKVSALLLSNLDAEEESLMGKIKETKASQEKSISSYEEELEMLQSRLNTAIEMANKVSTEGSDCDVASAYKPLTQTLKQLEKLKKPSCDMEKITFVERSDLNLSDTYIGELRCRPTESRRVMSRNRKLNKEKWNEPWKIVRKLGDAGAGKSTTARGIAFNEDGQLAVAYYNTAEIYIYDIDDGKINMIIDTTSLFYRSKPHDIAIFNEEYFVSDNMRYVKIYNSKGCCFRQIPSGNKSSSNINGVAIDSNGSVLVGCESHVDIYSEGSFKASLNTPFTPRYMAVSSDNDKIVISNNGSAGARVLSLKGDTIHILQPPPGIASRWNPSGVCVVGDGEEEEIFICNRDGRPSGVYRFSLTTGQFLSCVTNDVTYPRGIAFTDGRIAVAQGTCIKIFAPDR